MLVYKATRFATGQTYTLLELPISDLMEVRRCTCICSDGEITTKDYIEQLDIIVQAKQEGLIP